MAFGDGIQFERTWSIPVNRLQSTRFYADVSPPAEAWTELHAAFKETVKTNR